MLLDALSGPDDRGRSLEELDDLADQIRELIIDSVNDHGGHLGSNLGAVELSIVQTESSGRPMTSSSGTPATRRTCTRFTGRARDFTNLREGGGLSGYPSQAESDHDWIENSHASTVLSYAHGLATAFDATDARRRIVAVIGDGAMTGGMAFEGLNNLGHAGSDVTIVLNDNGRSYAPTVSRLSESLVKIRNNPIYMRRQAKMEEIAERIPWVGEQIGRGVRMSKAAVREMGAVGVLRGSRRPLHGPFDGHDIASMEEAFENAAEFDGPVVVHVLTQKGKGSLPPNRTRSRRCTMPSPASPTTAAPPRPAPTPQRSPRPS